MSRERRRAGDPVTVVAIPVKNEEGRIAACLEALGNQADRQADGIVLLLNDCTDRTAQIVRDLPPSLTSRLHVLDVRLPTLQASAGFARRLALEEGRRLAGETGVLMTTDADGRVDPDWVGANLDAIRAGADAVAGWAELDPADWGAIPLHLHEDDARECAYDDACDEIHALLDPDSADRPPRHTQASGASIAVTTAAYDRAGGMPAVPSGEDRAFIAALRRVDARIRHSPETRVVVSGRIDGRAVGGMADTIRRRMACPDTWLDDRLESADRCALRASLRWLARRVHEERDRSDLLQPASGLPAVVLRRLLGRATFGAGWAEIEALSPGLERRRVLAGDLGRERARALALGRAARRDAGSCRIEVLRAAAGARAADDL